MIPLVGTGGLFTRIGAVCSTINSINAQRGTAAIALTSAIDAQYNTTDQNIVTNLYTYLLSYQSGAGAYMPGLQKIAQDTITQMANDDLAQSSRSSLSDCLNYLISQMQGASQTIQSCLVSASVLYASGNIGNPNIVVSMKDVYGHALENAFYEQASAAVTNDGQSSSSLAMQEQI